MRVAVLLALWGTLLYCVGYHLAGRRRPLLILALTLLVTPLSVLEGRWMYREHVYSEVVRATTGRPEARLHCQRTLAYLVDVSGYMGFVPYPPDREPRDAYLRNDTCDYLGDYLSQTDAPTLDQIRAVHVLTHESMHLIGEKDEAVAECMAMQRNAATARLLGATEGQARSLARMYWTSWYPRVPSAYQSGDCGPGGSLDENLADPPWGDQG